MISAGKKRILRQLKVDLEVYNAVSAVFPVLWPTYYLDLVQGNPETHAIARMGTPRMEELQPSCDDLTDPVSDQSSRVGRFMVQKHADRVVVLVTQHCHFYCRFCFRREDANEKRAEPADSDWEEMTRYVKNHPEIREVILSGGDPLTLSDDRLARIISRLNSVAHLKKIRIHSRAPVHFPYRVTPQLIQALHSEIPVTLVTHFNHPLELTPRAFEGIRLFKNAGIVLKNQSVLLSGVNDCPVILKTLISGLLAWGIEPYYLHHPDRVGGNMLFRIGIDRGLILYRNTDLLLEASGLYETVNDGSEGSKEGRLPSYVLDLPDGKGKVPVPDLIQTAPGIYRYDHPDGEVSIYRDITRKTGREASAQSGYL